MFCFQVQATSFVLENKTKNNFYFNFTNLPDDRGLIGMPLSQKILYLADTTIRRDVEERTKKNANRFFDALQGVVSKLNIPLLQEKFNRAKEDYEYLYNIYQIIKVTPKLKAHAKVKITQEQMSGNKIVVLRTVPGFFNFLPERLFKVDDLISTWWLGDKDEDPKKIEELLIGMEKIIHELKGKVALELSPLDLHECFLMLDAIGLAKGQLHIGIIETQRVDFPANVIIEGMSSEDYPELELIWASLFNILSMRRRSLAEPFVPELLSKMNSTIMYIDVYLQELEKLIKKYDEQEHIKKDLRKIFKFIKAEKELSRKTLFILELFHRMSQFNQAFKNRSFVLQLPFTFAVVGVDGMHRNAEINDFQDIARQIIVVEQGLDCVGELLGRYAKIDAKVVKKLEGIRDLFVRYSEELNKLQVLARLARLDEYNNLTSIFSKLHHIIAKDYKSGFLMGKQVYAWIDIVSDIELIRSWIRYIDTLLVKYEKAEVFSYLKQLKLILQQGLQRVREIEEKV